MDTKGKIQRFRETNLGKIVSEEELRRKLNDNSFSEPCVLDFIGKRIFLLDEFFKRQGPESLYWGDVAALEIYPGDSGVLYRNIGVNGANNFDGFFGKLLDRLVLKESMRKSEYPDDIVKGDYLIDGEGISVKRCPREGDAMGNPMVNFYYPKLETDAFEYARAFCSGSSTISKAVAHIPCS